LVAMGGVLAVGVLGPAATTAPASPSAAASTAPGTFVYPVPKEAPPLQLTDQDGNAFTLDSLRGRNVLVFFGYTHCPDVCPATMGIIGRVLGDLGSGTRAVFVTVDPARDTTAWLKEYLGYLRAGFTGLTGTDPEIRATADAWGVRYARVETGSADAYAMTHTANVYLVDAEGRLRADFPFGTDAAPIEQTVRQVEATAPSPAPSSSPRASTSAASPSPSAVPEDLAVRVTSSSVWSGGASPVILALATRSGALADIAAHPVVQLLGADGGANGVAVTAVPVRPPGVDAVSYVATLDIPAPGQWRIAVTVSSGGGTLRGSTSLVALDPGTSAHLGSPAPTVRTPTLADVGGVMRAVSTDPDAVASMYARSTTDLLASHTPFVLIVDSTLFRVSPVCGKAVIIARYLVQRWTAVGFVHAEPFVYTLVSDWPVLAGEISDPPLDAVSTGWGIGGAPWGNRSVPWAFVVDGDGIVRAKYQGLMGTADIDVILALITGAK
ncbi:MAG TPA: SCO family protein, partial [Candidatus Dormibacteraeota bacterium]|nr:SCO family protein [Candidatus Dormibacteraeota bacterium]